MTKPDKTVLVCPRCKSANLGGPPCPGGADCECKDCETQFDVFVDDDGNEYGDCFV